MFVHKVNYIRMLVDVDVTLDLYSKLVSCWGIICRIICDAYNKAFIWPILAVSKYNFQIYKGIFSEAATRGFL